MNNGYSWGRHNEKKKTDLTQKSCIVSTVSFFFFTKYTVCFFGFPQFRYPSWDTQSYETLPSFVAFLDWSIPKQINLRDSKEPHCIPVKERLVLFFKFHKMILTTNWWQKLRKETKKEKKKEIVILAFFSQMSNRLTYNN